MATDTKKRKWPHQPARIQLVDVEEEDSDDETASAELNEEWSAAFELCDDEHG